MTTIVGGLPFEDDGRLRVRNAAADSVVRDGWGTINSVPAAAYTDLVASAVPATAVARGPFMFTAGGLLQCTTQATAGTDIWQSGFRFRSDGALRIEAGAPAAADPVLGGWKCRMATSAALVSVV